MDQYRSPAGPSAYWYAPPSPTTMVDPSGLIPEFRDEWWNCIDKAVGHLDFGNDFGWPKGMSKEKNCKGLTDRQCWDKIVRCLVWAESKDDPDAANKISSARGLMQIMTSCHKKGCTKRLRDMGLIGKDEDFNWRDPCQNITCGVYILYGCVKRGGLTACAKSTYISIPSSSFRKCMADWWPQKPKPESK